MTEAREVEIPKHEWRNLRIALLGSSLLPKMFFSLFVMPDSMDLANKVIRINADKICSFARLWSHDTFKSKLNPFRHVVHFKGVFELVGWKVQSFLCGLRSIQLNLMCLLLGLGNTSIKHLPSHGQSKWSQLINSSSIWRMPLINSFISKCNIVTIIQFLHINKLCQ